MTNAPLDLDALVARLERGEIVQLTDERWATFAGQLPVLERHDTQLRGELLIVSTPAGVAAVEAPGPDRRVVRPLPDEAAARAFVEDRLRTYARMWDGCGCRIDYFT